jgi:hypothetical protein
VRCGSTAATRRPGGERRHRAAPDPRRALVPLTRRSGRPADERARRRRRHGHGGAHRARRRPQRPWLSERLRELGVEHAHTAVVGDRPEDVRAALDFFAAQGSTSSSPAAGSVRPRTT